ncbi:MAG TPA: hypothetical protein VHZ03_37060 [Trebonia sp.]|jgi:hypothetical protein|nr:hypothetical protein [Trebonia sp.]
MDDRAREFAAGYVLAVDAAAGLVVERVMNAVAVGQEAQAVGEDGQGVAE